MYKRILMPTDGSDCSEAAIKHGLSLAKALGAEVIFLYALEDPLTTVYAAEFSTYRPQLYEELKASAQAALDKAEAFANDLGVRATTLLKEHKHPVQAIHEAEAEADLVVMGTHGRRGFNRIMFGSVAEGALRRSTKPYLMVKNGDEASSSPS